MAWTIEVDAAAKKELSKIDLQVARRITTLLRDRVSALDDPRSIGEALKGSTLGDFWKYRVGDFRIIASIEDRLLRILIVRIGNRREVEKKSRLAICKKWLKDDLRQPLLAQNGYAAFSETR